MSPRLVRRIGAVLLVTTAVGSLGAEQAGGAPGLTVGMPARIDQLVLPGTELEAAPIRDRQTPVVLRVVDVYPHGPSAFRYDLSYYALEPGEHDLRGYLRRKDGSSTADLPPILVTVRPILPPGQIEPNALELKGSPQLGGYRLWMVLGALAWFAGLVAILNVGRRRRAAAADAVARPLTLAERLRPLVEGAVAGTLTEGQHAELERLILGYWRRRLGLEDAPPATAIVALRQHEEAGPHLRRLEQWLHSPDGPTDPVDVAALLEPYRELTSEHDGAPEAAGGGVVHREGQPA